MDDPIQLLLPRPRRATRTGEAFRPPRRPRIALDGAGNKAALARLETAWAELGTAPLVRVAPGEPAELRCRIDPAIAGGERYELAVGPDGIAIEAADPAGLAHGLSTLTQWLRVHARTRADREEPIPGLQVEDGPDFPNRGVMLDVSRDKVPKLATLEALIDRLAEWKINQLQLYMEHTFAYRDHAAVWRDASPLDAADVRRLDAFCRARHVELVPNQNSFGHLHRWLVHEPYRALAEAPEGIEHPFSFEREPFSLCPTDPRSIDFLAGLYDELLPNFSSRQFNVGLDETFDLGSGRSAAACRERGKGRVYLDFLRQVHALVRARGRRIQFWGDVILEHPELIPELPRDAIALEWGYDADHRFASERFAASGLDFYVCPGTSSWNSFAGRVTNAVENLASAARHGQRHGAAGYLVTDWGDHGHLQPLPASFPGLVAGAAFGWNAGAARAPETLALDRLLDLHALEDRAGVAGGVVHALGDAYRRTGADSKNGSALFFTLVFAAKPAAERRTAGMTAAHLRATREWIDRATAPLGRARIARADGALVRREIEWMADVLRCACALGAARLEIGVERPLSELSAAVRDALDRRLGELTERRRALWLERNRPGGVERALGRLEAVRALLRG